MSPRSSSPKPKRSAKAKGPAPDPDIYVGLLFVAVTSLLFGIMFLVLELNRYQWTMGPS